MKGPVLAGLGDKGLTFWHIYIYIYIFFQMFPFNVLSILGLPS